MFTLTRPISRVACLAVTLAVASPAAAQPSVAAPAPAAMPEPAPAPESTPADSLKPVTFSLELSGGGCTVTDAQLAAAIVVRVPAALRVEAEADVAFHAEISDAGSSSLSVSLAQGSSRREFRGASCDEAAALIAFIASLVLDARPEERLKATELGPATETRSAPATETPAPPAKRSPASPPRANADRSRTAAQASETQLGVNAALAFETAVANKPPPGGLFGVSLRWSRASAFAPELRAELLVTSAASQPAYTGQVSLRLTAGRLSACPVRLPTLDGALALGACTTFDLGSLHARGSTDIQGQSQSLAWLAGGLSLLAEVRLSAGFELQLLAGVKALLRKGTFTVEADPVTSGPALHVYDVPRFSGGFALGLGFRP